MTGHANMTPGTAHLSTAARPHLVAPCCPSVLPGRAAQPAKADLPIGLLKEGPTETKVKPKLQRRLTPPLKGLGWGPQGAHCDLKVCGSTPRQDLLHSILPSCCKPRPLSLLGGGHQSERAVTPSDGTTRRT